MNKTRIVIFFALLFSFTFSTVFGEGNNYDTDMPIGNVEDVGVPEPEPEPKEPSEPKEDTTKPKEDTTKPKEETTNPKEDTTQPKEDTTKPKEETKTTKPKEETVPRVPSRPKEETQPNSPAITRPTVEDVSEVSDQINSPIEELEQNEETEEAEEAHLNESIIEVLVLSFENNAQDYKKIDKYILVNILSIFLYDKPQEDVLSTFSDTPFLDLVRRLSDDQTEELKKIMINQEFEVYLEYELLVSKIDELLLLREEQTPIIAQAEDRVVEEDSEDALVDSLEQVKEIVTVETQPKIGLFSSIGNGFSDFFKRIGTLFSLNKS
ncbi:hypothetical protein RJD24_02700 [Bacillaceae bacterium IKA-2]|nr:hypothetical protein RJD24_02700 [Bacillaceae bacterium IKA-2]